MSSAKLDQSLGDIISSDNTGKSDRSARRHGRGGRGPRSQRADGGQTERSENGENGSSTAPNPLSRQADSNAASASSSGPIRRNRAVNRRAPYPTSSSLASDNQTAPRWQHDRYISSDIPTATTASGLPLLAPTTVQRVVGDTIHISNLHHDVKPDDLHDIFAPLGHIRSHTVHFDEKGRSLGTASVTFTRAEVADAAVAEYDGAEVDGKSMSVKLVGQVVQQRLGGGGGAAGATVGSFMDNPMLNPAAAMMLPAMLQMMAAGLPPATHSNAQQQQQRRQQAGGRGRDQAGQRGEKYKADDRGKGREQGKADGAAAGKGGASGKTGRGKQEKAPLTAEDLDAEMESYHTKRNASTGAGAATDAASNGTEAVQSTDGSAADFNATLV